uniref:Uncharacterized protein n=1 Tax=Denticeps clupeoides TaxID=299321 RepID=A0AAY4EWY5_9TELE
MHISTTDFNRLSHRRWHRLAVGARLGQSPPAARRRGSMRRLLMSEVALLRGPAELPVPSDRQKREMRIWLTLRQAEWHSGASEMGLAVWTARGVC